MDRLNSSHILIDMSTLLEGLKESIFLERKEKAEVVGFIENHYLGKYPSAVAANYGVMYRRPDGNTDMVGVIIYGQTSKPNETQEIAVDERGESILKQGDVLELQRLYLTPEAKSNPELRNLASFVISKGNVKLREDYPEVKVVITRADSGQGHVGSIYQATNAIYLGVSKDRHRLFDKVKKKFIYRNREIEKYGYKDAKEAVLDAKNNPESPLEIKLMTGKHFYIYVLSGANSTEGKRILSNLVKDIQPYPKKVSENMTKSKLKSIILEAIYSGMVGIHELMMFYREADVELVNKVDSLFKTDRTDEAWHVVKDFLNRKGQLTTLAENKANRPYGKRVL